jgi:hypothetical protein
VGTSPEAASNRQGIGTHNARKRASDMPDTASGRKPGRVNPSRRFPARRELSIVDRDRSVWPCYDNLHKDFGKLAAPGMHLWLSDLT